VTGYPHVSPVAVDTLPGFGNRHVNETMLICGCGPSLNELSTEPDCITIGVNDVGRRFDPDYLVVVNPRSQFPPDRFRAIAESRARAVFSQYADIQPKHAPLVHIALGTYGGTDFADPNVLHFTQNSPYVALCLAIHMGATRIGLIGVDFTNDHFFGATGVHPLAGRLRQIEAEYARLRDACKARGIEVFNLSSVSRLSAFPRMPLVEFLQGAAPDARVSSALRIVSYATTPVAGVPSILARCITSQTPHTARCAWATNDYGNGVCFEGDLEWSNRAKAVEVDAAIADADVVIVHNGKVDERHRPLVAGKPILTLAHNYAWNVDKHFVEQGMPGLVVGQYQATLPEFSGWVAVPNPVPIWEDAFTPGGKGDVVTIAYTPSGRHERYPEDHRLFWHGKGYETTMRTLDALARRHRIDIIAVRDKQMSHPDALAAKRRAHIIIDECVTGSYHRNSLEGLAAGCVVINGVGLRPPIRDVLSTCAGGAPSPFVYATLDTLESELERLIALGPGVLSERGATARQWMEQHWQFAEQWSRHWTPAIEAALARRDRRQPARPRRAPATVAPTIVATPVATPASVAAGSTPGARPISVVIPHGGVDRLELLAATLAATAQESLVAEIIVAEMDDVPRAEEIVRRHGAHYVFIYSDNGFNKSRTVNVATALAASELVLWLDNDLFLPDGFLTHAVAELRQRNLDCLVPWTSVHYLSAADSRAVMAGTRRVEECRATKTMHTREGACGGAVLLRRRLVQEFGGMCEEFHGWGGEDNAWFHKARVVGRAAITERGDQHLQHLFHPQSGGYGSGQHMEANPHYQANVTLLYAMRRITNANQFMAAYPVPEHAPCPWDRCKTIALVADPNDRWAQQRSQDVRIALQTRYAINAAAQPPDDKLDADAVVIFGTDAARCAIDSEWLRTRSVLVRNRDAPPPTLAVRDLVDDTAALTTALVGPLSVILGTSPAPKARVAARAGAATALVAAASGIGDLIRVTPLIRVLAQLGHRVDFLVAPDDPQCVEIFRGAPEINRFIVCPPLTSRGSARGIPEIADSHYEIAIVTHLAAGLAPSMRAQRSLVFDREKWLSTGDSACGEYIARELGWQQAMPPPFAIASDRHFDLPAGTVVLHPGCKPNWPWKRWHGFAELAAALPNVAIVGTANDQANAGTYFNSRHAWPAHARDYTGQLNLPDTAALIAQATALVSNDSGLMHVGVAVGTPTFGIFGITNPAREIIPAPHMHVISKGLPCEPLCRTQPQGRRDCEHHLECLKQLTAGEVMARIGECLPELSNATAAPAVAPESAAVSVAYYGAVFDASGYGEAARAYIHALHSVGIRCSVVDTGARPPQVEDALVASLLAVHPKPDFHLFHGVPPLWERRANSLPNVIAMTVWETDTMPTHWGRLLNQAIDVWLPCRFNVDVFARALTRQPFCLPHPVVLRQAVSESAIDFARFGITADDFVFYACFEWQDRKNPHGIVLAFLRAFPEQNDAVLFLKTNRGAAVAAEGALRELRRETGALGRIVLCCEFWDGEQMAALHARGNCYVSLHKGEGWGYPLFEAAYRGTPVVATGYGGPLDYLNPKLHWLVRHQPAPVRQAYAYYHSRMSWSEPDIAHAVEGLRWVHAHRDEAVAAARTAAEHLVATFSAQQVGQAAKARLIALRAATPRGSVTAAPRTRAALGQKHWFYRPTQPIPADWYDGDYFETGAKSNWDKGYNWPLFKGVFEDAAACLTELFPHARSFLDIGCAKGFLVRALRARGMEAWGFDHSRWAIDRADEAARPFVKLGDIDSVQFDRQFDVVVAMSIFESLTEAQLQTVLPRVRRWTRHALFAVVALSEPGQQSGDLSHITLRDRDWWLNSLRQAGWVQDELHANFERLARSHRVPTRMRWNLHVVSAGSSEIAGAGK
jgi:ADP-heptose:LPS heptosyltransferase/glycosyltransferase involved in cell wall biosynthesis/SAM-dependent methyltransferase